MRAWILAVALCCGVVSIEARGDNYQSWFGEYQWVKEVKPENITSHCMDVLSMTKVAVFQSELNYRRMQDCLEQEWRDIEVYILFDY